MSENLAAAISLIKEFEGCALRPYQDLRGIWTVGYGHTHNVCADTVCTADDAEKMLSDDLRMVALQVDGLSLITLTDNQRCALISLVYNIGCGRFQVSTLLKKLNNRDLSGASDEFLVWDKINGKPCDGLLRRRKAERELFLSKS